MCVECDLAEPESLASLGGSAPGVVDGILSKPGKPSNKPLELSFIVHVPSTPPSSLPLVPFPLPNLV